MQLPNGHLALALTILQTKVVNEIRNSPKTSRDFDKVVREMGILFIILNRGDCLAEEYYREGGICDENFLCDFNGREDLISLTYLTCLTDLQ